uniref:Uncharacterized protein n=1 Tax=Populus trichocarpa TaxID=3694 RepID=A9PA13_POPTR|nr:unknown [Populus trichocarpa]
MEKSKSFPQYSSSFSGEFGFEDRSNSYNFNGPCQKGNGFATSSDPELKRRRGLRLIMFLPWKASSNLM